MRVLIDTNVILNYITGREDLFAAESEKIMLMCAKGSIEGYLALHSLSTIWYVTRKLPNETRRKWIKHICELLTIAGTDNKAVLKAIDNKEFKDFEDNLQDCCAENVNADYIITVNVKDYDGVSMVQAVNPRQFITLSENKYTEASME